MILLWSAAGKRPVKVMVDRVPYGLPWNTDWLLHYNGDMVGFPTRTSHPCFSACFEIDNINQGNAPVIEMAGGGQAYTV